MYRKRIFTIHSKSISDILGNHVYCQEDFVYGSILYPKSWTFWYLIPLESWTNDICFKKIRIKERTWGYFGALQHDRKCFVDHVKFDQSLESEKAFIWGQINKKRKYGCIEKVEHFFREIMTSTSTSSMSHSTSSSKGGEKSSSVGGNGGFWRKSSSAIPG